MLTSMDPSLSTKPSLEHFWNLEALGITDSPSQNDECAFKNLSKTVIFADGRYMVSWPWRESNPDLPQNYQLAVGRLKSTVMKLVKTPELFKQYDEIIQDQLNRGVTSTSPEGLIKHYIPHHPVITPSKNPTLLQKLRRGIRV